jgi:hypothetical protein
MISSWRIAGLLAMLLGAALACGLFSETADEAETVDDAVRLLQDIEDHGTWVMVADGLENLNAQTTGYTLQIQFRQGTINDAGEYTPPLNNEVMIRMQVDTDDHAAVEITESGTTRSYYIENYGDADSSAGAAIYRLESGRYSCVADSDDSRLLVNSPASLFDAYAIHIMSQQALAVATEDEDYDGEIADRAAIRYEIESKVTDAVEILERFDNRDLAAQVEAAGSFRLSGEIVLDDETGALLRYSDTYDDLAEHRRTEFKLEIVNWGKTPAMAQPEEENIETPCD